MKNTLIPYPYKQLDYISVSRGNSGFRTGIQLNHIYKLKMIFTFTSMPPSSTDAHFIGGRNENTNHISFGNIGNGSSDRNSFSLLRASSIDNDERLWVYNRLSLNYRYKIYTGFEGKKGFVYINDYYTEKNFGSSNNNYVTSNQGILLCWNGNGETNTNTSPIGRMEYAMLLDENNNILSEFYPCIDSRNNKIGLYNRVNKSFILNESGTISPGPLKNKNKRF